MKKVYASIALLWLALTAAYAQTSQPIELLKNPSFEEEVKPIRNHRFGPNGEGERFGARLPVGIILGWITPDNQEEKSKTELVSENLLDTMQHKALRWSIEATPATLANVGFQGIEVVEGQQYTLTFWARADKRYKGTLNVGLQSKHEDHTWYAQTKVKSKIKRRWKKYTLTFTAEGNDPKARFVMVADKPGTLYLDEVSLKHKR